MLYVFCGDRYTAREHSKEFVNICKKKRPMAEYIYLSTVFDKHSLEELLLSQGLFENKYIVFFDEVLSDTTYSKYLLDNLEEYQESDHAFVVFEPDLNIKQEKVFKSSGATIKRSKEEKAIEKDTRELFSFLDVFLRLNKTKTLSTFYKLLYKKTSASSILNILMWQLKTIALVENTKSASQTNLKPFVYTKSKTALAKIQKPFYTFTEAEKMIRNGRLKGLTDEEIVELIILNN